MGSWKNNLLYNHNQLYIHIYIQKHIQHNKDERTQFFRKIYLSIYWKGYVWEGVGDRTNTATYWPHQLFWLSQPFFPILLGCSTAGLGAQPLLGHGCHSSIFSPTNLNFLSPGLYNNLTPTYFLRVSQFALNSTPRQSRLPPDIFNWIIYTGAFLLLTAWPGSICNKLTFKTIQGKKQLSPKQLIYDDLCIGEKVLEYWDLLEHKITVGD